MQCGVSSGENEERSTYTCTYCSSPTTSSTGPYLARCDRPSLYVSSLPPPSSHHPYPPTNVYYLASPNTTRSRNSPIHDRSRWCRSRWAYRRTCAEVMGDFSKRASHFPPILHSSLTTFFSRHQCNCRYSKPPPYAPSSSLPFGH